MLMPAKKPLIIMGDTMFAELAYEYFTYDSPYQVVAFSVDEAYLSRTSLFGLPVIPRERLTATYAPGEHSFYAAMGYSKLNRVRARFYKEIKALGYTPASYISSRTSVWRNAQVAEHVFIFEDNVIQPYAKVGNNVILWTGTMIGHHSVVHDHVFMSLHVAVAGIVEIGAYGFYGVNATIINEVKIGEDCLIGAGALVTKDVPPNTLIKGTRSESSDLTPRQYFKVDP
jgi:sugar O-acyltransferase (sialic acid O-acetyltransferase NeuD family)